MLMGVIGEGTLSLTTRLVLKERNIDTISEGYNDGIQLNSYDYMTSLRMSRIENRYSTSNSIKDIVKKSDVIFIAIDTDMDYCNMIDNTEMLELAEQIGECIDSYKLIVIKSLVPVGTCKKVKSIICEKIERRNSTASFDIIYNPECYDRDDSYIDIFADSMSPSNIIIGIDRHKSLKSYIDILCRLYSNETLQKFKVVSIEAAEIFALNSVCVY